VSSRSPEKPLGTPFTGKGRPNEALRNGPGAKLPQAKQGRPEGRRECCKRLWYKYRGC